MGAQVKELPEGWHECVKVSKVWQWRCPWGTVCGKDNELLYEDENKETVLDNAAMHLCDVKEHDEFENFNIARDCAKDDGLTEITVNTAVYYDEDGVEHKDVPHATPKKMPKQPAKPPTPYERVQQKKPKHNDYYRKRDYYQNNSDDQDRHRHKKEYYPNNVDKNNHEVIGARHSKDRQKGNSSRDQYDSKSNRESRARLRSASSKHRRSRSRGRRASNCHDVVSNSASRTSRAIVIDTHRSWPPIPLATGKFQIRAGPRDHEVVIGRVELDQIMDSLVRASNAANACVKFMKNFAKAAEESFEAEREIWNASREALQRFSRA